MAMNYYLLICVTKYLPIRSCFSRTLSRSGRTLQWECLGPIRSSTLTHSEFRHHPGPAFWMQTRASHPLVKSPRWLWTSGILLKEKATTVINVSRSILVNLIENLLSYLFSLMKVESLGFLIPLLELLKTNFAIPVQVYHPEHFHECIPFVVAAEKIDHEHQNSLLHLL